MFCSVHTHTQLLYECVRGVSMNWLNSENVCLAVRTGNEAVYKRLPPSVTRQRRGVPLELFA